MELFVTGRDLASLLSEVEKFYCAKPIQVCRLLAVVRRTILHLAFVTDFCRVSVCLCSFWSCNLWNISESQTDISETVGYLCEILGLHGGDYDEHYRAAYDAV
jgi:hypothetical protein